MDKLQEHKKLIIPLLTEYEMRLGAAKDANMEHLFRNEMAQKIAEVLTTPSNEWVSANAVSEAKMTEILSGFVHKAWCTPLTRTQYNFCRFIVNNHEQITQIGELDALFATLRKYLKDNNLPSPPNSKEV